MTAGEYATQFESFTAADYPLLNRAARKPLPKKTLVVFAADDHLVEPQIPMELAAAIPGTVSLRFEEGGHSIQKHKAAEIARAIQAAASCPKGRLRPLATARNPASWEMRPAMVPQRSAQTGRERGTYPEKAHSRALGVFMKILMVLTSHDRLGTNGGPTGYWLEEFAAPYFIFLDAGAEVTLASPRGGEPPIDPNSDGPEAQSQAVQRLKADPKALAALGATASFARPLGRRLRCRVLSGRPRAAL
jgi:hypothetical protein